MRFLLVLPLVALETGIAWAGPAQYQLQENSTRIEMLVPVDEATLEVRPLDHKKVGTPLMGHVEHGSKGLIFVPVAPFLQGQSYRAQWKAAKEPQGLVDFVCPAVQQAAPQVSFSPQAPLPANALKFYLYFTEPMEQGVFLDRLRLIDESGKEVTGPFRETELWSPDGRRLTVWFHPGRQKTGVNLNLDEGPVLRPTQNYALVIAGTWRSAGGVAIGKDLSFPIFTSAADHECPRPERWLLSALSAGAKEPLRITFDKSMDPAMLKSALQVRKADGKKPLPGQVEVDGSAAKWSFAPDRAWEAGEYELLIDPALEDLAGNNLTKPFEVDLASSAAPTKPTSPCRRFSVR